MAKASAVNTKILQRLSALEASLGGANPAPAPDELAARLERIEAKLDQLLASRSDAEKRRAEEN